jgi:hypothetical protein
LRIHIDAQRFSLFPAGVSAHLEQLQLFSAPPHITWLASRHHTAYDSFVKASARARARRSLRVGSLGLAHPF